MARLTIAHVIAFLPLVLAAGTAICCASTNEIAELTARVSRLREQSRWTEALPLAEKLAELTAAHYGHDTTNTAEAFQMSGWMAYNNGDLHKAETIWRDALAIDEKLFGPGTIQTTRRLHMLATIHRDRGDYEKAESLLRRALELREKYYGPDHGETGQIVSTLGRLKALAGDYASAVAHLSRALRIFEKLGKYGRERLAGIVSALAWVYMEMGDRDQAERFIRRALELRRELHGWEHDSVVYSLRECATLYRAQGEFVKAEQFLQEAVRIRENLLGTNHLSLCELLDDLGYTLLRQGKLVEAELMFEQVRTKLEKALGAQDPRVASILMRFSDIEERRREYARAKAFAQRAHAIRASRLGPSHHFTVSSLRVLARLEAMLGNPAWALSHADQIQDTEERLLANALSFTSERQRLDFSRRSSQRYALWGTIGATDPLARAILRTKAITLDSMLEDRQIAAASRDPDVAELLDRLRAQQKRAAESEESPGAHNAEGVANRVEFLEATLARRVTGLGRARRSLSVQVEDVRSALPRGTVLLEWLRYRHYIGRGDHQEHYGVLILSGSAKPCWVRIGPANEIERAVKFCRHALCSPPGGQHIIDSLQELYRRLWVPLSGQLPPNTRQILISPDGELNFVSFAALLNTEGQFLGEQHLFSYVASGRDLLAEPGQSTEGILSIWANPDFATSLHEPVAAQLSQQAGGHGLKLSSLPWAEREGQRICGRARALGFTDAVLHVGAHATEAKLSQISSPKALHLATHGIVLPRIETGPPEDEQAAEFAFHSTQLSAANPMLLTGLALAGAQHTLHLRAEGKYIPAGEDGILTAAEIATLNLRGTRLVVLAACDTALGEARAGEGVLGLRRAFMQAGAQNVLLTLWPIQDESSEKFMTDFYERLQNTPSPAKALALVQQSWLKRLRKERGPSEACRIAGPYILSFQGPLR